MTALCVGCSFIAVGPAAVLLLVVALHRSHMALVATSAAFSWLVGMALASLLDLMQPAPALQLVFAVAGQESMRAVFVRGCLAAERTIASVGSRKGAEHLPLNDAVLATGK
jgi:Aph-1 protein